MSVSDKNLDLEAWGMLKYDLNGLMILQRESDGYINVTQLCRSGGKEFRNYTRSLNRKGGLTDLWSRPESPAFEVMHHPDIRGTYAHPDLAIEVAAWLSPQHHEIVTGWILTWAQLTERLSDEEEMLTSYNGTDAIHKLREADEVKQRAVEQLLNDNLWSQRSNQEIALRCGASPHFVEDLRKSVGSTSKENAHSTSQDNNVLSDLPLGAAISVRCEPLSTNNDTSLISRNLNGQVVFQRQEDGYIHATKLCQAAGKQLNHYLANAGTKAYLEELSASIGIPVSSLVQAFRGTSQGTWMHPSVAIHLGQWLPRAQSQVSIGIASIGEEQSEYINSGVNAGFSKSDLEEAGSESGDASLLKHELAGVIVLQQPDNGYINLNQIANAAGKRVRNWLRLKETQELLAEFDRQQEQVLNSSDLSYLKQPALITKPGKYNGGTWGHPDIAIAFAQWCSPAFTLQVSRWVREWMTTGQNPVSPATPATAPTTPTTIVDDPLLELIQADMQQVRVATPFVLAWKYDALKALNPHRAEMLDAAKKLVMANSAEDESLINPTNIGKVIEERAEMKVPGAYVNKILEALGYQQKSETAKCRWILTEEGEKYGRAVPYKSSTGHEGYQILWMPSVIDKILEYLKNKSA